MSDDEMNIDDGMYLLLYWYIVVGFYVTLTAVSGGAIRRKGRGFQNKGINFPFIFCVPSY